VQTESALQCLHKFSFPTKSSGQNEASGGIKISHFD
jgi:hypothetical protein